MNTDKPIAKQPHEWTDENGDVLILKSVPPNRKTYNNFEWPENQIEFAVPDVEWNPTNKCGGGLHGWPWMFGLGEGKDFDIINDHWFVLAAKPTDIVGELEGGWKCKARRVRKVYEGLFSGAVALLKEGQRACIVNMASGDGSNLSASGNGSNLSASGDGSNLSASGDGSKLSSSGNDCVIAAANINGTATVGKRGAFALAYWHKTDGWRFAVGKEGENGIKAGVTYTVDVAGNIVVAK